MLIFIIIIKSFFHCTPKNKEKFKKFKFSFNKNVNLINPVKYTNYKINYKKYFCFTDSGGIQEEAIILKRDV